jgi:DNA-3-methyladenine glycosylase II
MRGEMNSEKMAEFGVELRRAEQGLARRDEVMRRLVKKYGPCSIRPHRRYFETLVKSIVSQQLSTKAAETIFARFRALYPITARSGFPAAEVILRSTDDQLRGVGLSFQKIGYIRDLAGQVEQGRLRLNRLSRMSDDEVVATLTAVKGVGVWTAQMFLIFSLARLDVFPVGDLGVRKAIQQQFGLETLPAAAEMEELASTRGWAPWRSVASWYLWRSLENSP